MYINPGGAVKLTYTKLDRLDRNQRSAMVIAKGTPDNKTHPRHRVFVAIIREPVIYIVQIFTNTKGANASRIQR